MGASTKRRPGRIGAGRLLIAIALLLSATPTARAEAADGEAATRRPRITEGALLWRTAKEAPLEPAPWLLTEVEIQVTGIVARATVRQAFTNPSAVWAEGVYVFPLPEDAAVDHMRMRVGERLIEGQLRERAAAKATYDQARREGKRVGLVEQERPNVFTASVGNIPPGAPVSIEIEYQQSVRWDAGWFRLRFPMVVGPRYIPGAAPAASASAGSGWGPDTDQVPDGSRITPPVRHPSRGPINPVRLSIELDPGMPLAQLEAAYHEVRTTALADGRYRIELAQVSTPADRDFELAWRPQAGAVPEATLLTAPHGDDVFGLLMVVPPAAGAPDALRGPREAIFVIDVSGSMHGASIDQARASLRLALSRLRPTDTFNVIQFNHRTSALFAGAVSATAANLRAAERYVDALRAEGGTEMLPALLRALDTAESPERLRQVIFLTDGAVGNEEELFQAIRQHLGDSRLFTIGIGSAPNSHFMREAARLGRGTFTYIGSPAEVQAKMVALFAKLESPALTDVNLDLSGATGVEALPARIPDLYLGEPVVMALRARALPSRLVIRGRLRGEPWERDLPLRGGTAGAGLSAHWARARIDALLDQRRPGAPDDDVRRAVLELALTHHLVSPYTSLVAVDVTPVRPGDQELRSHALETNLPQGWDYTAVFGQGQGATAWPLHLAIGVGALALAAAAQLARRRPLAVGAPARTLPVALARNRHER